MTDWKTNATTWTLARAADCASPDKPDRYGWAHDVNLDLYTPSPGAEFLRHVEDAAREAFDSLIEDETPREQADDNGALHMVADGAVPMYTHGMWQTFVDLAAYQEDLDDLGGTTGDMERDAQTALYLIAYRLTNALIDAWYESASEDKENDDA
jgi:hypothetical protein